LDIITFFEQSTTQKYNGPEGTDIVYNANPVLDYLSPYLGSV